jgi:hypothetical protein
MCRPAALGKLVQPFGQTRSRAVVIVTNQLHLDLKTPHQGGIDTIQPSQPRRPGSAQAAVADPHTTVVELHLGRGRAVVRLSHGKDAH